MRKETISNYAGVIYEMAVEVSEGKPFEQVRRETAAFMRKYDKVASRDISLSSPKEFAEAYQKVELSQQVFDVKRD
jgi:hypothetical protein